MDSTRTEPVAAASADLPDAADRALVLVHGIGSQDRGTVLASWGGAIVEWLREAGEVEATVVRTGGEGGGPMWADVVVRHKDGPSLRLRLVEALWADVVRPPSFLQLLLWARRILPIAVVHHITAIIATYLRRIGAGWGGGWPSKAIAVTRVLAGLVLGPVLIFLTGALTPLVLLALVVSLILGALGSVVPVAAKAAGKVQQTLTSTLGDTTYLLTNPVQAAYIHQRIIDAIDHAVAATNSAGAVTVLAHSQGAAATHGALLRGLPQGKVDLVTVGQGLAKIDRLRSAKRKRLAALPSIGMPITALAAYLVVRAGVVDGLDEAAGLVLAAAAPPVVAVLIGGAILALIRSASDKSRQWAEKGLYALTGVEVQLPKAEKWSPSGTTSTADPAPEPVDRNPFAATVPSVLTSPHPPLWIQLLESFRPLILSAVMGVGATAAAAVWRWLGGVVSPPEEIPRLAIAFINVLLFTTLTTVIVLLLHIGAHRVAWPLGVRSWLDLWASADPVANGPLAAPTVGLSTLGSPRFDSREVVNHHSVLLDHTSYHRNATQVIALLLNRVLPDHWVLEVTAKPDPVPSDDAPTDGTATSPPKPAVNVETDAKQRGQRLATALRFSRLAGFLALPAGALLIPDVRLIDRLPIDRWVQLPAWAPMAGDVDRLVVVVGAALLVWLGLSALSRHLILGGWYVRVVLAPVEDPSVMVDLAAEEAAGTATQAK